MTDSTAVFHSTSVIEGHPGYPERSGQTVQVIREMRRSDRFPQGYEVDEEVGSMFKIRFPDGTTASVFENELVKPGEQCENPHMCRVCERSK